MSFSTALVLSVLLGCSDDESAPPSGGGVVDDRDTGWPDDTGPEETGTDEDADGWTVEEGDCNDDDIMVNPGRDEEPGDGVDNDCDGRIDEDFSGVVVVQVGGGQTPNVLHGIDTLGQISWTVELDDPDVYPYFCTWGVDGGYVIVDYATAIVYEVDEAGVTTELTNFEAELKKGEVLWTYGITTHPDGFYVMTTINALYAIEPGTGTKTPLAVWDYESDLQGFDVAIDLAAGEVGIFGFYGGFATWSPDAGMQLRVPLNPKSEFVVYSGEHRDGGGWYAGAWHSDGFKAYRLDEESNSWIDQWTFSQQWSPTFFTIDSDSGNYFLAANAATYPNVWFVSEDGTEQYQFYESEYQGSTTKFWDIYSLY